MKHIQLQYNCIADLRVTLAHLLTKKMRNNGIMTDAMRSIKTQSKWDVSSKNSPWRSLSVEYDQKTNVYSIHIKFEIERSLITHRLEAATQAILAKTHTRLSREKRRALRKAGLYQEPKRTVKRVLSNTSSMKRHYRNHRLMYKDAVTLIARAAKISRQRVTRSFEKTLDFRHSVSLRLKGGFVFRIDVSNSESNILDLHPLEGAVRPHSIVVLYTSKNNIHGAYRRLRSALGKHFGVVSKERQRRQKRFVAVKKQESLWRLTRRVA